MSLGKGFSPSGHKHPKPVKEISLSEKHITLRVVLFIIFFIIAVVSIFIGIKSCFSVSDGWQTINVDTTNSNASGNLILYYNIGQTSASAKDEATALTNDYTLSSIEAYKLYSLDESANSENNNVGAINAHPNTELNVPSSLYNALNKLSEDGNRYLFQAPIYELYNKVFTATDDDTASFYDPNQSQEQNEYVQSVLTYSKDSSQVSLSFLGNNKIKLNVSDNYLKFLKDNSCTSIIDFGYLREAAYVDYLADSLSAKGYANGYLTTKNGGFARNLSSSSLTMNYFEQYNGNLSALTSLSFQGDVSLVDFSIYSKLDEYSYAYSDKTTAVLPFFSTESGLYSHCLNNLFSYSNSLSCLDIASKTYGYFVASSLNKEALLGLDKNIHSLFMDEGSLYCDSSFMEFQLHSSYSSIPIVRA